MANITLSLDGDIAGAIADACEECAEDNAEMLAKRVEAAGKEAADELKKTSRKKSGKYAKGWRMKLVKNNDGLGGAEATVYQFEKPHLTHLLENGHATRNGGRVAGDGKIAEAYEHAARSLKGGGQ